MLRGVHRSHCDRTVNPANYASSLFPLACRPFSTRGGHRLPRRWKRSHIDALARACARPQIQPRGCLVCGALFAINRSLYTGCIGDPAGSSSGRSCSDRSFRDRAQYESYVPGSYRGLDRLRTAPHVGVVPVRSARSRHRYTGLAPLLEDPFPRTSFHDRCSIVPKARGDCVYVAAAVN